MQKEEIIQKLKENGCRITRQRMILLDVILQGDCSSCKEIYYKASHVDNTIGTATVYRMMNLLEEIGAIHRRNMYEIEETDEGYEPAGGCRIEQTDQAALVLTPEQLKKVLEAGLRVCGYEENPSIGQVWFTANK